MTDSGRRALAAAKWGAIALAFGYVAATLVRHGEDLRAADVAWRAGPVLWTLPFAIAYLLGRALVWHAIARRLIGRHPLRLDVLSWLASLVGKYLPGKVFLLLGRVALYRGSGASAGRVSVAFAVEAACAALATIALFALAVAGRSDAALGGWLPALAAVAVALAVVTHPRVLEPALGAALRLAGREPVRLGLRWGHVWLWTALLCADWLILGAGFHAMLRGLFDVPASLYLFTTGAFAVAGLVGVMAVFAPSGIGVREGVMTFVLATALPPGVAAAAALLARVWMTAAEALCSGVALLLVRSDAARGEIARVAEETE